MDTRIQYKTFSGTDTLVFMLFPNCIPICIGSISTLSYSISRQKQQVNLLGRINVGGFTRGTRIVAGTLIFTLINQHWVNDLIDQIPYLQTDKNLKSDELPLFDLMIVSANEYGASVASFIYGVDIVDDGEVISIEDMFTETQCRYIARDIDVFKENKPEANIKYTGNGAARFLIQTNSQTASIQNTFAKSDIENSFIQARNFDEKAMNKVKMFQMKRGLNATGFADYKTVRLMYDNKPKKLINKRKYKVPVFENADERSNVTRYLDWYETIYNFDIEDNFIKTDDGYIRTKDLIIETPYDYYRSNNNLKAEYTLSECLNNAFNVSFNNITANFDIKLSAICHYGNDTETYSKQFEISKDKSIVYGTANIPEAFMYSPKYNKTPDTVEIIIYPIGYKPIKHIIKIVSEENEN